MELLGYLGAVLTGVSLGLVGGGGSILIVPILVYLFHTPPTIATAYSLFVVGIASSVAAFRYAKKDLVAYKIAMIFATPAFFGVFISRRFIIPGLPNQILDLGFYELTKDALIMIVFSLIMLLASFSMIRKKAPSNNSEAQPVESYNKKLLGIEGFGIGILTGFVGAGGGFIIIPTLVFLAKLPMKKAIGTSLLIIAINSLLGFLGDVGTGNALNWIFLLSITLSAVFGIFLGIYLSTFIPGQKLKPAFGWFVLVMGSYILIQQLFFSPV